MTPFLEVAQSLTMFMLSALMNLTRASRLLATKKIWYCRSVVVPLSMVAEALFLEADMLVSRCGVLVVVDTVNG